MDVQDRSLRLDVLTITTPTPAATPTPTAAPQTPSFADALQRTPNSAADSSKSSTSANSSPQTRAPSGSSNAPSQSNAKPSVAETHDDKPSSSADGTGNSAPTSATQSSSNSASSTKPDANPPVDPPADDPAAVDDDVESLVASLVAATTAAPAAANNASPVNSPPASLIKALQATTDLPGNATAPTAAVQPETMPQIPAGLQAGLAPASLADTAAASASTSAQGPDNAATTQTAAVTAADATPVVQASPAAASVNQQSPVNGPQAPNAPAGPLMKAASTAVTPVESAPAPAAPEQSKAASSPTVSAATAVADAAQATAANPTSEKIAAGNPAKTADSKTGSKSHSAAKSSEILSLLGGAVVSVTAPPGASGQTVNGHAASAQSISGVSPADRSAADDASLLLGLSINSQDLSRGIGGPFDLNSVPSGTNTAPSVVDQLQPALQQALSTDRQMTITLRPPELGAVQIDVTRQDGQLSARLQTETASAQQLLTDHLPQLREALTQMGVSADQVQIVRAESPSQNASQFGSRTDGQADMQNAGGRQDSQQQRPAEPQLAEEPSREESSRPDIRTRTALNLRI
jgi:flagellar hook-length control protein FliK